MTKTLNRARTALVGAAVAMAFTTADAATIDLTGGYSYSQVHGEYPFYSATGLSSDFLEGNGVTPAENTTMSTSIGVIAR